MVNMARWGYVVVASQYRGNDGGEGREEFGGADVNDVLNLLPVLEQVTSADTARLDTSSSARALIFADRSRVQASRLARLLIAPWVIPFAAAISRTDSRPAR